MLDFELTSFVLSVSLLFLVIDDRHPLDGPADRRRMMSTLRPRLKASGFG